MFPLLNCCVEATVNRLGKILVCLVPGGDALIEVVEFGADVWERWKKQKPAEADRREELQALAHASAARVEAAVQAAIQDEAAGQPAAVKRKLTTYLIQVQVTVRRTLCRPTDPEGRTVPTDLHLSSGEDLLPFLPPDLPRFEPGELESPPAQYPSAASGRAGMGLAGRERCGRRAGGRGRPRRRQWVEAGDAGRPSGRRERSGGDDRPKDADAEQKQDKSAVGTDKKCQTKN